MAEQRRVSIKLPLLFGGISNQPPHIRFPNQVDDAENFVFSVKQGASKRPGTQLVAAVVSNNLPNGLGSGSSDPAASGTAPATCTPGNHAATYTVTFDLTGTDSAGTAISHTSQTAACAQHSGACVWSKVGTVISTLTPVVTLLLDTKNRTWDLTFLFNPATAQPVTLQETTSATSGADPDLGTYADTAVFGEAAATSPRTTYSLKVENISIA